VAGVQQIRAQIEPVLATHPAIEIEKVAAAATMAEFDHWAIAPMMECASASHYYREASAATWQRV
jgi:predicted alpha/beta-fold hydrolase